MGGVRERGKREKKGQGIAMKKGKKREEEEEKEKEKTFGEGFAIFASGLLHATHSEVRNAHIVIFIELKGCEWRRGR